MMRSVPVAAALASALCLASPASAQGIIPSVIGATIGNMAAANAEYEQCLSGKAPKESKVAVVRGRSQAAMGDYVRLAGAAAPADAASAFSRKAKLRGWSSGGQAGDVSAVDDPIARALAADGGALPPPERFVFSGDRRSATGIWIVRADGPDGAPLGHYRAAFRPEGPFQPQGGQLWKITRLELVAGAADPAELTQYCSVPGDVEQHRIAVEEYRAERARKKAEKAARRASVRG